MANPGITFGTLTLNGLVEEIDWAEWDCDRQESHAFAVAGTSSIQGAVKSRDIAVPIIVYGFGNQLLRDAAVSVFENLADVVAGLQIRGGGGVVLFNQTSGVKLLSVKRGKSGYDGVHAYWRRIVVSFRQLTP